MTRWNINTYTGAVHCDGHLLGFDPCLMGAHRWRKVENCERFTHICERCECTKREPNRKADHHENKKGR